MVQLEKFQCSGSVIIFTAPDRDPEPSINKQKNLDNHDFTVLCLLYDMLSLKNDVYFWLVLQKTSCTRPDSNRVKIELYGTTVLSDLQCVILTGLE